MYPRIFVSGTGRSGTWILYKALGCHEAIHTFPSEMRFLVDPDGLFDLVDALTNHYHPVQAQETLYRFERLMRVYLTVPDRAPYLGFDFPNWLGGDTYWQRLDQFCSELVELEYTGNGWHVEPSHEGRLVAWAKKLQGMRKYYQGQHFQPYRVTLPRNKLKIVKYFSERSQLIALTAAFVDDLFLHAAHENGKQTWCEKTPQHLLTLDFLWELFPHSVIIHIKRDPRGVAHSLTKQSWAPNDLRGVSLLLRNVYSRWFDLKNTLDLSKHRYLELKLEDLAKSPHSTLAEVASFCGLENRFENLPDIRIDKVNYWQRTMKQQDVQLVNDILGCYIDQLGYQA